MKTTKENLPIKAIDALQLLIEGNKRFTQGLKSVESISSITRIKEFAEKRQLPLATIITCSDSRVPTETIFDRGLGELFVVRVAGNVISTDVVASVEYAASELETPLCIVMGHTHCGAVRSSVNLSFDPDIKLSSHLKKLLGKITPSVEEAKKLVSKQSDLNELMKLTGILNVKRNISSLFVNSSLLQDLISQNKFAIVGANYNLHTGSVEFNLDEQVEETNNNSEKNYDFRLG